MSEYQRYEFMTCDNPLTPAQRAAVGKLSSHIEVSATRAVVEYEWGDFKHDAIKVLHDYFDSFLYWANWGSPQLAFRFPHGMAPVELFQSYIVQYDLDELVTLIRYPDCDILDIHFGDLEGPEEWAEHDLATLLPLRDELLDGDLRALYIAWLAAQRLYASYASSADAAEATDDAGADDASADDGSADDSSLTTPPVPVGLSKPSVAHRVLARLLQLPAELLTAVANHSEPAPESAAPQPDVADLLPMLSPERGTDYLLRLARNEPGLSRLLTKELRELRVASQETRPLGDARTLPGERIHYQSLFSESVALRALREREKQERARLRRARHLQEIHDNVEDYWRQVEEAAARGSGVAYDEATHLLIELREAAEHFQEEPAFTERFNVWLPSHKQRRALMQRLRDQRFSLAGDAE
jgi:hypothetical protein